MEQYTSVDEYLAAMPTATRAKLQQLRGTIRREAPDAVEKISYGIPTFTLHGNLVHFAGYEHHIGFYPGDGALPARSAAPARARPRNRPLPRRRDVLIRARCGR
jgi:uncharacterized protein YdhG (YjbR/CyaY superfamily)